MPLSKPMESTTEIVALEIRTDQQRKTDLLKPLTVGLAVVQFITLSLMLTPPVSPWYSFITVGLSFFLNLAVLFLIRRGHIGLVTHLFCHNFNVLVFLTFLINIIIDEDLANANLFGFTLALSILLAGMLISPRAAFGFATLNSSLVFISYLAINDTLGLTLRSSVPIIGFLFLIALISWLFQRTLNRANTRLSAARQQLLQTQLIQRDLKIARDLQLQLYPNLPDPKQHMVIAARCEPARVTSGDFYDFIELGPDEWGIIVADVAGKSLPAALGMAMARSTLRSEARSQTSPAIVLRQANQVLHDDATVEQMVTVCYGILNARTLQYKFSNAGHIYPFLKHNGRVEDLELTGLPLRAMPDARYGEKSIQLEPGDQLILTSDGIVEAMNTNHKLFGFERLIETIDQIDSSDPHQILRELWQAVDTFRGEAEQYDDMTVVVIGIGDQSEKEPNL